MHQVWIEVIKQVPALAVLVLLVIMFIKHLNTRDSILREVGEDFHRVNTENMNRMLDVLKENTIVLGQNVKLLDNIYNKLSEIQFLSRRPQNYD